MAGATHFNESRRRRQSSFSISFRLQDVAIKIQVIPASQNVKVHSIRWLFLKKNSPSDFHLSIFYSTEYAWVFIRFVAVVHSHFPYFWRTFFFISNSLEITRFHLFSMYTKNSGINFCIACRKYGFNWSQLTIWKKGKIYANYRLPHSLIPNQRSTWDKFSINVNIISEIVGHLLFRCCMLSVVLKVQKTDILFQIFSSLKSIPNRISHEKNGIR